MAICATPALQNRSRGGRAPLRGFCNEVGKPGSFEVRAQQFGHEGRIPFADLVGVEFFLGAVMMRTLIEEGCRNLRTGLFRINVAAKAYCSAAWLRDGKHVSSHARPKQSLERGEDAFWREVGKR